MSELYWLNPFIDSCESEPILRDVFDWTENGIFVALKNYAVSIQSVLPWGNEDPETLDLEYFSNHSGGKFCAPVVKLLLETEAFVDEHGRINSAGTQKLAAILFRKYLPNWKRLWDLNDAVYNPIHNYDMVESRNLLTANSSATVGNTSSDETITHGRTTDETDYKLGINTVLTDPKPSDKVNIAEGGETGTESSSSNSSNRVAAGEETEELHRSGNIGVTTTQKMISEERELWKWNYFDQIFSDVDRELALMFHDSCRV